MHTFFSYICNSKHWNSKTENWDKCKEIYLSENFDFTSIVNTNMYVRINVNMLVKKAWHFSTFMLVLHFITLMLYAHLFCCCKFWLAWLEYVCFVLYMLGVYMYVQKYRFSHTYVCIYLLFLCLYVCMYAAWKKIVADVNMFKMFCCYPVGNSINYQE